MRLNIQELPSFELYGETFYVITPEHSIEDILSFVLEESDWEENHVHALLMDVAEHHTPDSDIVSDPLVEEDI